MSTTKKYVSLEKLGLYDEKIKKVISDGDAATLASAKSYADGLAVNYDAAGAAATAEANAKAYADGKDAAIQAAHKAGTDAAAAAATADGKAVAAQGEVDALESYVGTFTHDTAKSVVEYINAKTDGIATSGNLEALAGRVTAVEGDVATIKGDYLKSTDKTELNGKITAVETAIANEQSRAEGIEAGLRTDVDAIKSDYLKSTDKTALQDQITANANAITLLTNGVDAEKVDGVKDLIDYVDEHGTEVTGMKGDISANASAIEGVAGRMTTAEGKIADLEAASATHATKDEVKAVSDALSDYETAHAGDYTNTQIDAAIKVNTDAIAQLNDTYATDEELTNAINSEVSRANGAYAVKSLETTVADHLADTVSHVTADDKTLWNAALQASDITTGAANGAIAVNGVDVAVKGLGSAAFANTDAFDAAGSASTVQGKLDEEVARAKAAEEANAAAIAAFVEVSEAEINALFA